MLTKKTAWQIVEKSANEVIQNDHMIFSKGLTFLLRTQTLHIDK